MLGIKGDGKPRLCMEQKFHKLYGSSPLVLSEIWYDLCSSNIVTEQEQTKRGFKSFLVANCYLWTYEKNSELLASRFSQCERYSRGKPLWDWIKKIAALSKEKIVWPENFNDESDAVEIYGISADGVDFKVWEKPSKNGYNIDREQMSVKFSHGALKYIIALSIFHPKCVFFDGPYRGGLHDIDMFRKKLKQQLLESRKKAVVDRGFRSSKDDECNMLCCPDKMDSKEVFNFESRARLRHETFNGRLKFFNILSSTFRHGEASHKIAFSAVVVIVQYQMDNGSPIYMV